MTVQAHAKVNLTLEVFGRRADGYHSLRSVVMPVSLCDTLEITPAEGLSSDTGYADDLCLKAATVLREERGVSAGAEIRVEKRIPAGGGLGGGSADAAAALLALNEMWELGFSRSELAVLGARVGSDVPSLVLGGAVLMEGRGEVVSRIPGSPFAPMHLVLAAPREPSSTARVYAECVPREFSSPSASARMADALRSGDVGAVADALSNDLREPAARLCPGIAAAEDALRSSGAIGVSMSGSGSTVFGLVGSESEGLEIAAKAKDMGFWAVSARTVGVDFPQGIIV